MPKDLLNSRLHALMLGLYYPAVLGTALVVFILRITLHQDVGTMLSDFALYYGFLFIIFFSACFLAVSETSYEIYGGEAFFLDILEVIAIFIIYYLLGLFNTDAIVIPDFSKIYWVLAVTVALQQLWSVTINRSTKNLWGLRIITVVTLIAGAVWGYPYMLINILLLCCLYILVWIYINKSLAA